MITGYFGLPGSGKTTFLTMLAQKELKRMAKGKSPYKHILTNFYCEGCEKIDFFDLGLYRFDNALILLDEITIDADNRDFKNFGKEKVTFFVLHRHYFCDIIYFTQQWDAVDKKIRSLTSNLFYVTKAFSNVQGILFKPFQCFSVARKVFRQLEINDYTNQIVYGYRFPSTFERFFGRTKQFCYRPKWYKYFDSWETPEGLSDYSYVSWQSQ